MIDRITPIIDSKKPRIATQQVTNPMIANTNATTAMVFLPEGGIMPSLGNAPGIFGSLYDE